MRYILLTKVIDGKGVELRALEGPIEDAHVGLCAQVAQEEGFHLLYELDRPPDMEEAARLAQECRLVSMEGVLQLHVLTDLLM